VTTDGHGNVWISDTGHCIVYMLTPSGTVSPFAGTGTCGYKGDGGKGFHAEVNAPTGLALDPNGPELFIADTGNNVIRMSGMNENISTFAGTGTSGYSGDGGAATSAQVNSPTGVTVAPTGFRFITDTHNHVIRQVDPKGVITTYAGNHTQGYGGDGGPAASAKLDTPTGSGSFDGPALYFADTNNQIVRGVFTGPPPSLPESSFPVLLPITGGLVLLGGAGVILVWRRRRSAAGAVAV
jgi:hypothetical protein